MITRIPDFVPTIHRNYLEDFARLTIKDDRIVRVAVGGSFLSGSMDDFSDLDLVVVVEPSRYDEIMDQRTELAAKAGTLLTAFTGEHIGEPRLLICLYDHPLLHVDLKFVCLDDLAERFENPEILWQRDERVSRVVENSSPTGTGLDRQWIEDRFWIWVHYITTKIGRGELFEAINGLSFLRYKVLGPLCKSSAGKPGSGVRRLEMTLPHLISQLSATVASYSRGECMEALRSSVDFYRSLRSGSDNLIRRKDAERAVIDYLSKIESMIAPQQ